MVAEEGGIGIVVVCITGAAAGTVAGIMLAIVLACEDAYAAGWIPVSAAARDVGVS